MSGLMEMAEEKLGQSAENYGKPGDGVEQQADNVVNSEVDKFAEEVGVPQGDDQMLNEVVDSEVNSEIPGGN